MVTPSPCSSELLRPWVGRSRSSLSRSVAGVPLLEFFGCAFDLTVDERKRHFERQRDAND